MPELVETLTGVYIIFLYLSGTVTAALSSLEFSSNLGMILAFLFSLSYSLFEKVLATQSLDSTGPS